MNNDPRILASPHRAQRLRPRRVEDARECQESAVLFGILSTNALDGSFLDIPMRECDDTQAFGGKLLRLREEDAANRLRERRRLRGLIRVGYVGDAGVKDTFDLIKDQYIAIDSYQVPLTAPFNITTAYLSCSRS